MSELVARLDRLADGASAYAARLGAKSAEAVAMREAAEIIRSLQSAAHLSSSALRMQEAWEADLIMSELEVQGVPAPTQSLWDKITDELQPARHAALAQIRSALNEASDA
jgi:hypothetical protein